MAWRHHRIWIIAVLLISGIALAWLIAQTPAPAAPVVEPVATTTPDLVGQSIYTNGEYGFAMVYPASAAVEDLPRAWRANAPLESKGTPIVTITTYTVPDEQVVTRALTSVSIGASTDPVDMSTCERITPDRGETQRADETFGGATWKVFAYQEADMQLSVQGVSYRTLRDGTCYALETYRLLKGYKEEGINVDEVTRIDAEYAKLDEIVKSFSFAR
ncbi:MAG: hypothetical protein AAB582_02140 [Patescibacteria group bacterium]